jgi:cytidylate kinase
MEGFKIAIDGPAGSGKSSVARRVARELGMAHLDTGATYRGVALAALRAGVDPQDGAALAAVASTITLTPGGIEISGERIADPELRTPEVSAAASEISRHPEVRRVLVERQRASAEEAGSVVMEGRDIGTVVLPDAGLKVFLSATPEERALRRARQSGRTSELERIRAAIATRDRRDSERRESPLRAAEDAVVLDTTHLDLDQVVERVLKLVVEKTGG